MPAGCEPRKRRTATSNVATRTACHLAPPEASVKSYWSRSATSMASGSSSTEAPVRAAAARRPRFHSSVSGTPDRSTGIGSILAMATVPLLILLTAARLGWPAGNPALPDGTPVGTSTSRPGSVRAIGIA
jgi:hypothetical protein